MQWELVPDTKVGTGTSVCLVYYNISYIIPTWRRTHFKSLICLEISQAYAFDIKQKLDVKWF